MNILFMGTPDFAIPSLDIINKNHNLLGVFTKIDKPNKRGNKIKYVPVKQYALDHNIEIFQPNSVKDIDIIDEIKRLNPDLIVVVAYGKILPKELIDIPKYGVINVHSSLLPKYRGAAPIHNAIINGDKETGVSIMYIDEELDSGDIISQAKVDILEEDNLETVHDKLADIGAKTLIKAISDIEAGTADRFVQDHSKATFVYPIKKEDCEIDWFKTKAEIFNFVRGMNPFPTAFTILNDKNFKIYEVVKYDIDYDANPGEIVELIKGKGPVIKCGDGAVVITKAKPQNKKLLSGNDLLNGNYFHINDRFNLKK